MTQEEAQFIWSLMPLWVKEQPNGLDNKFYGTLSREGDVEISERVRSILNL